MNKRIKLINQQELEIRTEINLTARREAEVVEKIKNITSIPGVGDLTAVTILAETNGFELIRNKRQLVSYCGLDVKNKDSGISVKRRPRISKKGTSLSEKHCICRQMTMSSLKHL